MFALPKLPAFVTAPTNKNTNEQTKNRIKHMTAFHIFSPSLPRKATISLPQANPAPITEADMYADIFKHFFIIIIIRNSAQSYEQKKKYYVTHST